MAASEKGDRIVDRMRGSSGLHVWFGHTKDPLCTWKISWRCYVPQSKGRMNV